MNYIGGLVGGSILLLAIINLWFNFNWDVNYKLIYKILLFIILPLAISIGLIVTSYSPSFKTTALDTARNDYNQGLVDAKEAVVGYEDEYQTIIDSLSGSKTDDENAKLLVVYLKTLISEEVANDFESGYKLASGPGIEFTLREMIDIAFEQTNAPSFDSLPIFLEWDNKYYYIYYWKEPMILWSVIIGSIIFVLSVVISWLYSYMDQPDYLEMAQNIQSKSMVPSRPATRPVVKGYNWDGSDWVPYY
jgi:hypothetical protein